MVDVITKYSVKLSKLLKNKADNGLLKQLRKVAFWHGIFDTTDADKVFQMMGKINYAGGISSPLTFGTTEKSNTRDWVFLFNCDEASAINLIKREVTRNKVPHKVLVRMVKSRIDKTKNRIDAIEYNWQAQRIPHCRELYTQGGFDKALRVLTSHISPTNTHLAPHVIREVEYLLNRDDMTDEVIDAGWDLWKDLRDVREVMDS